MRAEVIMSLGRIGPDAAPAIPALIPLLGDKSERIRREAVARARADRYGGGRALDRRFRAQGRRHPRRRGREPGVSGAGRTIRSSWPSSSVRMMKSRRSGRRR